MKKVGVVSILLLGFAWIHMAFNAQPKTILNLKMEWQQNSNLLQKALNQIEVAASSTSRVQATVEQARLLYKEFEFLYAYYYPDYVKSKINGAPLLHLDPYFPKPIVLAPNGLQRLDELAHSNLNPAETKEFTQLATKLYLDFEPLKRNIKNHPIEQRELLEAMRSQLIRTFTLGVTGFDTPGSLNAINEAAAALKGMQKHGLPVFEQSTHYPTCDSLFSEAVKYLQSNPNFDKFDRLSFLKQFINPLYKELYMLHKQLHIETIEEVFTLEKPVNYKATNLFDSHFLNPYYYSNLSEKQDSKALQELGKALFYSKKLSANNTLSCASCHNPNNAFADGLTTSLAIDGVSTLDRNAPTLINSIFSKRFFADMRARRFDDQMEHVITNHKEFNTSYFAIFKKLEKDTEIATMFRKAFGQTNESINQNNFNLALNAYLISLTSFNSAFDQYVRNERKTLSVEAKAGFNLFMGKAACGTCHFAPTFAGLVPPDFDESESEVLGVLATPTPKKPVLDADRGRANNDIPKESDVYFYENSFKTSTVRNIALTAPYFHNGAYQTLEQVVNFYNHGGGAGLGLAIEHQTLPSDSLNLTEEEKKEIIAFMNSLTDSSYVHY